MADTSAEATHSNKRPRVDEETTPKRRGDPWKDGNIVLEAKGVQFGVHSSMLEDNSAIFSDMLSMPRPDDQAMVEGCPVVQLQDDSLELSLLLYSLYSRK